MWWKEGGKGVRGDWEEQMGGSASLRGKRSRALVALPHEPGHRPDPACYAVLTGCSVSQDSCPQKYAMSLSVSSFVFAMFVLPGTLALLSTHSCIRQVLSVPESMISEHVF